MADFPCFQSWAKGSVLDVPKESETKKVLTIKEAALFYASVASRVQQEYVEPVSQQTLLEGALEGMLSALDPHSSYLSSEKLKMIQDSLKGEYGGLGMEVTLQNGQVLVVSPMDDTPADRAGLKPGDYILKVDGKSILNQDLGNVVKKMQGKPGTSVVLTLQRGEQDPFDVTLSRAIIPVNVVKWRVIGDVGYIRLISFMNKNTKSEVVKAIDKIQKKLGSRLKGFVLDLRNNAGGLLDQAVDVTDIFIKSGTVVSIKGRHKKTEQIFKTNDDEDLIQGLPMVVLINGGSASASEIVAGALQDHRRAVITGTQSFGKGSVQVIMPMTNGGALKLTTAFYYTPSGRSIQKEGVHPDVEIHQTLPMQLNEEKSFREEDFSKALKEKTLKEKEDEGSDKKVPSFLEKNLEKKKKGKKQGKKQKNGPPQNSQKGPLHLLKTKEDEMDFQLKRALDVLKGMSIYAHSISASDLQDSPLSSVKSSSPVVK